MTRSSAHVRARLLVAGALLCGCGRACQGSGEDAAAPAVTSVTAASAVTSIPSVTASAVVEAGPPPLVTFRIVAEKFVAADEDAGRYLPLATTTLRVEIAGWSSSDLTIGCVHPTPSTPQSHVKPRLLGLVSCYVSAQTTFLAVVERSAGQYAVTTWSEDEATPGDTPHPIKLDEMKVVATLKGSAQWTGPAVLLGLDGREVRVPPNE